MAVAPIFLITGTPAVGKSTFSRALMQRYEKGVHIPVDDVREFVVSGIAHPMEWNDETERQFQLAERAAADMARRYQAAGFAVAIDHCRILSNHEHALLPALEGTRHYRVCLLADLETMLKRNRERTTKTFDHRELIELIQGLQPQYEEAAQEPSDWIFIRNEGEIETAVDELLEITTAPDETGAVIMKQASC